MRIARLALGGLLLLIGLTRTEGAEKGFLLNGIPWQLEDVSSDVTVTFQSLVTNATTGGWNVDVSLTNHGSRDLYIPLVLSIDSYTGTTGPLAPDGLDEDTPPKPFFNLSALRTDGLLPAGSSTGTRTLALGPGASPQVFTRVFAWLPPPDLRITDISIGGDGRPLITHTADTNYYYVLLAGEHVVNIGFPAAVALATGINGLSQLRDSDSARTNVSRFYRVRKVPMIQPIDSDGDGIDDVYELRHAPDLNPQNPADASNIAPSGRTWLNQYLYDRMPLTTIVESSPAKGESGVAVTRETIFRFNQPLAASTVLSTNNLCACFGGRQILSRIELSSDHKTVTLFYQEPLPASARVRVTFNGTGITDYLGRLVDLDGDGQPGGDAVVDFDTLSITPVPKTAVIGHVFASLQVPVVGTNTTNFVDHPLAGVRISVVGAEQDLWTVTDAQGYFSLSPCPAGRFFVTIDGHNVTGTNWLNSDYYPVIGKPWQAVAGRTNNLAGGTGLIYLPLVSAGTLQVVSPTADTPITFPSNVVSQNPLLKGVSVTVPANALYDEHGTRGGMVGIAPVPGDRLPEPLPPMLHHVLDITVQTDGSQNVDKPLPVRFPNLPDPVTGQRLPPGAKSALMSYNHDTGRWEVQGPMTVSGDGNFIDTDPGVGVRQPGWHGTQPGTQGSGGPILGPPPTCTPTCTTNCSPYGPLSAKGEVTANVSEVCINGSFTFTAPDVKDPGAKVTVRCTDASCNKTSTDHDTGQGSIKYHYEVMRDGAVVDSGDDPTAPVSMAAAGIYTCRFTANTERECAPSSDLTLPGSPSVKVAGIQKVTATGDGAAGTVSRCKNTEIQFDAQVQQVNCGNLTYSWTFSDGGSSTSQSPTHLFAGDGVYSATVTVACSQTGCTDTKSDTITVNIGQPLKSVLAKANGQNPVDVYVDQPVHFTCVTDPPNMVDATYTWSFGDGASANGASTDHSFKNDATVQVEVRCGNVTVSGTVDVHVSTPPLPPIEADIVDDGSYASGVDPKSIKLTINNNQVSPLSMPIPGGFRIYYVPKADDVRNPNNAVHLEAADNAVGDGTVGNATDASWDYPRPGP